MNLLLSIMENLRTTFKYTYLTDKDFAQHVDFPYTEEIDNDGKVYFLYDLDGDKKINVLSLSKAKELSIYVKPTFYLPKTTAYIEGESIHVVVNRRHIVLSDSFTLRYIPRDITVYKTILYEKYKLSVDTRFVAFYEPQEEQAYCIPLTEAETNLLSLLLDEPIQELKHMYRL